MKLKLVIREEGEVAVMADRVTNGRHVVAIGKAKMKDGTRSDVLAEINAIAPAVVNALKPPKAVTGKEGVGE